jgi:hypothetical protein
MTVQVAETSTSRRRLWRSVGVVLLGFLVVAVLSLGTDQLLHMLQVYPPWGQPMWDPRLNLLALAYRCVYAVLGSYIAAWLAPRNPMRHAMALGVVGLVLSSAGAVGSIDGGAGAEVVPDRDRGHRIGMRVARRGASLCHAGGIAAQNV